MVWIDYVILTILVISSLIAIVRGFMREALSLIGWAVAIWVALAFMPTVDAMLADQISIPLLRQVIAFFGLFAAVLVAVSLLIKIVDAAIDKVELEGTDRALGAVFGFGRGALIIVVLVLFVELTPLPDDPAWKKSLLVPYFESITGQLQGFMPESINDYIRELPLHQGTEWNRLRLLSP